MTTVQTTTRDTGHPERRDIPRGFAWGLLALAGALVLNTLAGPLVLDRIDYGISESVLNQLIGLEIVTLVLVVPALVAAAVLGLRQHPSTPLVAFGPAAYAAYMFVQYVLGPEYAAYSVAVFAQVAITSLAGALTLWSWSLARDLPVPPTTARQRRWRVAGLVGLAAFVLMRYLPAFGDAVAGTEITAEYSGDPTFYWTIVLLDLGVVVPATALAAWALWRRTEAGERATYAVLGWFALVPPSVAAMAAVMLARDDPHASAPTLVLLSCASVIFFWFAVRVFRGLRG